MRIQHNIPAMNALSNYTRNNNALAANLEKLSSGYRINSAADDAAGLAISEKMRSQIKGLEKAYDNANDGISLVQTAEGALTEVNSMLTRLTELATQSANGTYQEAVDREAIQEETNAILDEIDRISKATNFNGINLLDGSLDGSSKLTKSTAFTGDVIGLNSKNSTATSNIYAMQALTIPANITTKADGDKYSFNVSYTDNNGVDQQKTITYTYKDDGTTKSLVDENGKSTTLTAAPTIADFSSLLESELKNDETFSKNFDVSQTSNAFTFTAKDKGSAGAVLKGFSLSMSNASNVAIAGATSNATLANSVVGQDSQKTYDLSSATIWDGTKDTLEAAIFEIDGQKFVFTSKTEGTDLTNEMKAMLNEAGVGSNYIDAVAAINDGAVSEMAHQIETATGLKVTQGHNDTTTNVWTANSTAANATTTADRSIIIEKAAGSSTGKALVLQIGDTNDDFQKVSVDIKDMSSKGIGIEGLDLSTQESAGDAIKTIKNAVNLVSAQRGRLGALQNRLDHTLNNLDATTENITSAESQIRDVNMAKEMTAYTKNNILAQAAQSMLAQANSMPQGVLQLLQ